MKRLRLLFLPFCAVLYLLALRAYFVGFFNDDAFFIIGARSLLQGHYVELNQLAQPPILHYTPGTSLLLMPFAFLFPTWFLPYQLFSVALVLGSLALAWALFEREIPHNVLGPALVLSAINPITVSLSGTILSEIPSLFFALLFLWWAKHRWDKTGPMWIAYGMGSAFLFYLRPAESCVVMGVMIALLLEKKRKAAGFVFLGFVLALVPYLLRGQKTSGSPLLLLNEYEAAFLHPEALINIGRLALSNSWFYLHDFFARTLFRWPLMWGQWAASLAVVAAGVGAIGIGFTRVPKKGWIKAVWLGLLFYALIHLVWSRQVNRYLLPVLPFLMIGFLYSLKKYPRLPWMITALSLFFSFFPIRNIIATSLFMDTPINTPPLGTYQWIKQNTNDHDVFGVESDGRFYLLTNRKTEHLPRDPDPVNLLAWVTTKKPTHILIFDNNTIAPTYSGNNIYQPLPVALWREFLSTTDLFVKVFEEKKEGAEIYRVISKAEQPTAPAGKPRGTPPPHSRP